MARPTFFFIDGNNQMYRAYHAIRGLSGPDGSATNAVYGFVTMLRKLIADHHPDYILASFDLAGPTFRDSLSADYKANRTPMPPDLVEQVARVHEASLALGVQIVTAGGFEADDVIGTLAKKVAAAGFDAVIVTGDKDFFQLVGGPIRVFNPRDEGAWFDEEGVVQKLGVRPDQVVDVLALMGDSIDNVKGVPGIGEKGARELIASHGTLDALLEKAADVPQKRYREALVTYADQARHSRELLKIRTDVEVPFEAEQLQVLGGEPRAVLRPFLEARVPDAVDGIRAHGRDHPEAVRRRRRQRRAEPSRPRRRGRRRDRAARADRRRQPDARDDRRLRDRDRAAHRVVRPCRAHRRQPARSRPGRHAARRESCRPQATARTRNAAEDRARLEDRSRRAGASWRDARGAGPRHDDRELPDRPDALRAHARRHRAGTSGLQGARRRGRGGQGRQSDAAGATCRQTR